MFQYVKSEKLIISHLQMNLIALFYLVLLVVGSPGDKLKRFKRCNKECQQVNCASGGTSQWNFVPFDPNLSYLFWSCQQDCDYQCQMIITTERVEKGRKILQFHGKWPFRRIAGIQEVASAALSLGNFVPHLMGLLKIITILKRPIAYESRVQLSIILASSIITCFAWVFSTIFHIRDFLVTERLDYYFAGLTVLSGLYTITIRFFNLNQKCKMSHFFSVTVVFISIYIAHVYRLVVDWLYTYNMQANVTVGIVQNIIMGLLCYRLYSQYYQRPISNIHMKYSQRILLASFFHKSDKLFSLYPMFLGAIVVIGMSLEIFDFPPILQLIDAHSLWHLVTIFPVIYGWYEWLIWDCLENIGKEQSKIE